jgi:AcrR family transcriptional regulator
MAKRKPAEPAGGLFQVIRFANYLEAMALDGKRGTRGERSKLRLMAAGADLLDSSGYQDLKIEDIAAAAKLAKGTFYIYFKTKDDFLRELVQRYCDFEPQTIPRFTPDLSTYATAREFISWYERTFVANLGIIRCMVQMGAVDPTVRECWLLRNGRIVSESVEGTLRSVRAGSVDRDLLIWVTRTTGGMLDQSLFDRYGLQTPTGRQDPFDDDTLAEMHTLLIYRGIYGRDPPESEVRLARSLVAMSQQLSPRSK